MFARNVQYYGNQFVVLSQISKSSSFFSCLLSSQVVQMIARICCKCLSSIPIHTHTNSSFFSLKRKSQEYHSGRIYLFVCFFGWCVMKILNTKEREREREREKNHFIVVLFKGLKWFFFCLNCHQRTWISFFWLNR